MFCNGLMLAIWIVCWLQQRGFLCGLQLLTRDLGCGSLSGVFGAGKSDADLDQEWKRVPNSPPPDPSSKRADRIGAWLKNVWRSPVRFFFFSPLPGQRSRSHLLFHPRHVYLLAFIASI